MRCAKTGKVRHRSRRCANKALHAQQRCPSYDGWPLRSYWCEHCGDWHFGHMRLSQMSDQELSQLNYTLQGAANAELLDDLC